MRIDRSELRVPARAGPAFFLLEAVIAIGVLATLSVLLVGVIPATVIGLRSASERATAATLAANAVADLRRLPFDQLSERTSSETVNGRNYQVHAAVAPAVGSDGTLLDERVARELVVSVRWLSKQGAKEHVVCTRISRSPR
ncbi:MAG: hypothetical protein HY319_21260 [Armatimonadetes bacterium]|nr:hypothetical protein [Armatimonadota bacterium]